MELFIIKRDGKKEPFSIDKVKKAISKAFLSVGSFATQDVLANILSRVSIINDCPALLFLPLPSFTSPR